METRAHPDSPILVDDMATALIGYIHAQEIWGDQGSNQFNQEPTGLPIRTLQFVGSQICQLPPNFKAHPEVSKLLEKRMKMIEGPDSRVDWGMGESLAFGTLVLHRYPA